MPSNKKNAQTGVFNVERARRIYNLANWADGYFDVDARGRLVMRRRDWHEHPGVDLYALVSELREAGLGLPVLVRFQDILCDRFERLDGAFRQAMAARDYRGRYTAVYPIKVNQQRSVVEQILRHGGERIGLEAGSKPELMAVLALARNDGVIVCNGYKDRQYIRLALIGRKLGHRVYIVVEKPSELELIIQESRALNVAPLLGVRVRLTSIGRGKWQNTGGDRAKFGLSAAQVQMLISRLQSQGLLARLQLLHFHMGSQLTNLRDIDSGLREAGRYYAELRRLGADIRTVDVGGGLGVDYEGTRSRAFCSMNYSLREYADAVVENLAAICEEQELPQPDIVTEAGRAMTAHHAVLITQVIDVECAPGSETPAAPTNADPAPVQNLWRLYSNPSALSAGELYHEAGFALAEARALYDQGRANLAQRARAEQIFFAVCREVMQRIETAGGQPREVLAELQERLADKYFCNFSVFQSVPDVWAFNQIFPIVPLHRLDEPPLRRAILQDLTCDSDGQIRSYVDSERIESTLPLHDVHPDEPYLLGLFLVGAYQETLGDMHNLFGDVHTVNVELLPEGGHRWLPPEHGDTVDELLRYVHFDPRRLRDVYEAKLGALDVSPAERAKLRSELEAGLTGYTYLD